ncbi:SDR family NAD(P)-dependent oxidoreductase [Streptomyces sp. CA-142005]|uniref:SDR family NAD(P)-dependent oxidoreductase n=1 Tax=Streptomyces sp. CA-142005 TaxID=3240052 RepID=UPI003D920A59
MDTQVDQLVEALRNSLIENEKLREAHDAHLAAAREPIAIVSMACRFPGGVGTPEELWQLVAEGRDAVTPFPVNRGWDLDGLYDPEPGVDGKCYAREGGFLHDADRFDPGFFNISPGEALVMDPQQRLLLEVAQEAFERAGIPPHTLKGSRTGVFAGVMYHDYALGDDDGSTSGGSVVSGRVAYTFGLEGPAVTVDTACSSSLVTLHLAVQALRSGECGLALAGGVTVMSTPETFVEFSKQRGLSPDGRCKAFAEAADGTGWGEGAGLLLLERLSDARRLGHPVLAVVRGSAVNQDGASNGLTAPNGPSQQRVIRAALASAGLSGGDVDLVEAHGTGTRLGDPIEAQALLATYGRERGDGAPLYLGSVKSNLGHTQAAAGVAGVIKLVEAMRHGLMPRTLHVDAPSSQVDWSAGAVELLTEARGWLGVGDRPRRAAVSSFGISGTNAHVILEQADESEQPAGESEPVVGPVAVALSARTPEAVAESAGRLADWWSAREDVEVTEVASALAHGRGRLEYRAVVVASSREEAIGSLASFASDGTAAVVGRVGSGRTGWLFTGQGSQWLGMGRDLYDADPVFAEAFDRACAALDVHLERPLREVIWGEDASLVDATVFTQAGLFAVQAALVAVLRHWGIPGDVLLGHSIGEISAAYAAGVLSLEDAARLVAARGALMQALPAGGGMLALATSIEQTEELIAGLPVDVAAVNAPTAVVVSAAVQDLETVASRAEERGIRATRLSVSHAFHSRLMEPMLEPFTKVAASLTYRQPNTAVVSNVTGQVVSEELTDPAYWVRHVRQPVRFADGVRTARDLGVTRFVEVGPQAVLTALTRQTLDEETGELAFAPLMRRPQPLQEDTAPTTLLTAAATLHTTGLPVDWHLPTPTRHLDLPTYPFQRRRYWLPAAERGIDAVSRGLIAVIHPLLGAAVSVADTGGMIVTGRLSLEAQPWLADHAVNGTVLFPGTAFVELALRVGEEVGCDRVDEVSMVAPLVLPERGGVQIQVVVGAADEEGRRELSVHSRRDAADWLCHAQGFVSAGDTTPPDFDFAVWPPAGSEPVNTGDAYTALAADGYDYGPVFQGLRQVWRRGDELFVDVVLPEEADGGAFGLHPALLDAALHGVHLGRPEPADGPALPFSWRGVTLWAAGASRLRVAVDAAGGLRLADADGRPVGAVEELVVRPVATADLVGADVLHRLEWRPTPLLRPAEGAEADPGAVAVVTADALADVSGSPVVLRTGRTDPVVTVTAALQQWLAEEGREDAVLVVAAGGTADAPLRAAVAGLVRAAQAEHPGRFVLADVDDVDAVDDASWRALAASGEPEWRLRDGVWSVPRLVRATPPAAERPDWGTGAVLVTGGTGGVGAEIARHLVADHGVTEIVLLSRSGADAPGAAELVAELTAAGARARAVAGDVADRARLAEILKGIPDLGAVVHAAGILDDAVLTELTPQRHERVRRPKATAAEHLAELTRERDLSAFVLVSSVAGVLGAAGQANYAAANAYLDGLAEQLRQDGRPATSVAFGLWREVGMGASLDEAEVRRTEQAGLPALTRAEALEALDQAVAGAGGALLAARLLPQLAQHAGQRAPLLAELFGGTGRRTARAAAGDSRALARRLAEVAPAERLGVVLDLVRTQAATLLGYDNAAAVDPERPFSELGFDSLTTIEMRNRLGAATELRLPATLLFDYPTPQVLARHVLDEIGGRVQATTEAVPTTAVQDDEPIAIVSMACRYPGDITTPEQLWRLVVEGRDAVSGFPTDRGWDLDGLYDPEPGVEGKTYSRYGAFLHDADRFDAAFFNISPTEAVTMDPQQRLLLETSWEAFERAGIDPVALKGSRTGVFAGVMYHDYGPGTSSGAIVSGRVSYVFGFEGPALTVDTACSSSLVALHLAVQALRSGECGLALAGGVTVMSTPETFVEFSRQRGLSPDGRCKAFAEAADGTGWGEGAGLLLLERLSDARRLGHPVLAVVRGSAVNQDGASNGLTAPNGPSQQRVIRAALASAGLSGGDVDLVEAHGTGTRLGDPIEAQALLATYGRERGDGAPLYLGSVKSNLGHTQAAAGVAGVIKLVEAMRHGLMPRTLHVDAPSSQVDWSAGAVELLTEARGWLGVGDRPRRAAVSSFGISGTNAHVIVEQAPQSEEGVASEPVVGPVAVTLSARSPEALTESADRLADWWSGRGDVEVAEVASALVHGRAGLEYRAVVVASSREEAIGSLSAFAADGSGAVTGRVSSGRTGWLFTGQGSQWLGMGRELHAANPVFAEAFDRACAALDVHLERPLREVIWGQDASLVDATVFTQAGLFAVQTALVAVLRHWGIPADVLLGHSIGEVSAVYAAGVLSLEDAARLVAARGALMQALPAGGGMLALSGSIEQTEELIAGLPVDVAAVNAPAAVVVSAAVEDLATVQARAEEQGIRATRLSVSHAFHSRLMEPMLEAFAEVAASLTYREPAVPVVSNVTGQLVSAELTDPAYWVRHVRQPVRFADGVRTARELGVTRFVEVGPQAVLTVLTRQTLADDTGELVFAPLMRRPRKPLEDPAATTLLTAAATLHATGVPVDWHLPAPAPARHLDLPTYPFQRDRYWQDSMPTSGDPRQVGQSPTGHPLLGAAVTVADSGGVVLTGRLSADSQSWLADHEINGSVVVPASVLVDFALRAAEEVDCAAVEEFTVGTPLVLSGTEGVPVQVSVGAADDSGRRGLSVHLLPAGGTEWVRCASGTLSGDGPALSPTAWLPPGAVSLDLDAVDGALAARGQHHGPAFRTVRAAWRDGSDVYVELGLPERADGRAASPAFALDPRLLEGVCQVLVATSDSREPADADTPLLAAAWRGISVVPGGAEPVRAVVRGGRLALLDAEGVTVGAVDSLALRPMSRAELTAATAAADSLYLLNWVATPLPDSQATGTLPVVGLAEVAAAEEADVVVCDCPLPATADADAARTLTAEVLAALRDWVADPARDGGTLVIATTGEDASGVSAPAAEAVAGLVRAAQAEHPGRFVLVGTQTGAGTVDAATWTALATAGEPEWRQRDGDWQVPRLARASRAESAPDWGDGTVLITGGTGGLGALVARRLVAGHGVRSLVLVSRRGGTAPGAPELVTELRAAGAEVRAVACDIADREALAGLLADIDDLTGVVHAAGVLHDAVLTEQTEARLDDVWMPKAEAAWHLHELTERLPLRAFVLFSSVAGVLGSAGQTNYAAANGFLDGLARLRRAAGLSALSIAYGLWQDAGMGTALGPAEQARTASVGMPALGTEQGLALLDAAVAGDEAAVVATPLLPAVVDHAGQRAPLLSGLFRAATARAAARRAGGGRLARRLADAAEAERVDIALRAVQEQAALVLGHPEGTVLEPDRPFTEFGFDSLTTIEMRNRLGAATGLRLPVGLLFDHPTCRALARHLVAEVSGTAPAAAAVVHRTVAVDEPIAIVAMACRFPGGVGSPEDLWRLVADGVDAVTGFPTDRGWDLDGLYDPEPGKPGRTYARGGAFLTGADRFDPAFFNISPVEALAMDPQQRLFLETTWEVLERAGIDPATLVGSDTGVFTGTSYQDYGSRLPHIPDEVAGYVGNGTLGSVLSGRVSYVFGFEGPAVTVDTACSSSLVALHLAAQALRSGECTLALAGGATVMSTPETFVEFSRQRGLAPDGRCKAFAEAADGTGWGEGVGLLLVERLSDARRLGHPVLAVVRGSAVNQDGASNGLTAPNGPSQQRVIRAALANAGLSAADVDVVEAHGTGTRLGDPIEAQALLATYGQARRDHEPLYVGSVKSNLGHTQAAAGVAGVIKLVEAMRHGVMPRTLHVDAPSSQVDWSAGAVELLTEAREWPGVGDRPRRAAVSSFGISGTNAHVILEQAAEPEQPAGEPEPVVGPVAVALSARTPEALAESAGRLADWWSAREDVEVAEVASALAHGRAGLEHRAVVVASSREAAIGSLASFASDGTGAVVGRVSSGRTGWLFTGQGSQWLGMGRELYDANPVFAEAFDRACAALDVYLERPLREVVWGEDASLVDATVFTQAGLFAVQAALVAVLRHWGIPGDVLLGHSIGEVSAAYAAGVLSLEDAARLVAARGALMQALPAGGGMLALATSVEQTEELIAGVPVDVAAVNAPAAVVVSGVVEDLETVQARAEGQGIRATRLSVSHAFHSRLMEPMLEPFAEVAASLTYRQPNTAVVSNVTGQLVSEELTDPAYWVRHVRQPVRFADGVRAARELGVTRFVEVGPQAVLTALTRQTLDEETGELAFAPLMRRPRKPQDETAPVTLLTAAATLHATGVPVDWHLPTPAPTRHLDLPTYPFQRRRYWLSAPVGSGVVGVGAAGLREAGHGLLVAAVSTADGSATVLTGRLGVGRQAWLAGHRVAGRVLVPGAALVDMALHAADVTGYDGIGELVVGRPLVLPEAGEVDVQVQVTAAGERAEVSIHSRPAEAAVQAPGPDTSWTTHATGTLTTTATTAGTPTTTPNLTPWPPQEAEPLDPDELYNRLARQGHRIAPQFQTVQAAWQREGELFVEVALPDDADSDGHRIHPALLDGLCQLLAVDMAAEPGSAPVGATWRGLRWESDESPSALRMAFTAQGLSVSTVSGRPVAYADSVILQPVPLPEAPVAGEPLPEAEAEAEDGGEGRSGERRRRARHGDPERFVRELREQDDETRIRLLLELVREQVAQVLGHSDAESVDPDKAFSELGFDSMAAVEVRNRLSRHTGLSLPSSLVFDHPTARSAADRLDAELRPAREDGADALLARMSRLDALLASASPTPEEQEAIQTALESLVQRWRSRTAPDAHGDAAAATLDDASDDELFAVLDAELSGG